MTFEKLEKIAAEHYNATLKLFKDTTNLKVTFTKSFQCDLPDFVKDGETYKNFHIFSYQIFIGKHNNIYVDQYEEKGTITVKAKAYTDLEYLKPVMVGF